MHSKITEVQIIPVRPNNGLVGFASFIYDDAFHFSSIGIYTRPEGGYRLTYPNRKMHDGGEIKLFYPINKETGILIEEIIKEKYEEILMLAYQNQ